MIQQKRVAAREHLGLRRVELLGRGRLHQEGLRVEGDGGARARLQPCDVGSQVEVGDRVHALVLYGGDVVRARGLFLGAWNSEILFLGM